MLESSNYREILKDELNRRHQANPLYSLRAFARDIGLEAPRLSDVLNGKHGLSRIYAQAIAKKIGFSKEEKDFFCDLVESQHGRGKLKRQLAKLRLEQRHSLAENQIQLDTFKVISDWYHFAILELALIKFFKSDPKWIAKQLGLNVQVVKSAIDRLLRLNFLKKDKKGRLSPTSTFTSTPDGIPSQSIKYFHKQILEKALTALVTQSVEERDFSAMTMAFDSSKTNEAKEYIRKFRRNFSKSVNPSSAKKDSVYSLSVQFFRLNKKEESHHV